MTHIGTSTLQDEDFSGLAKMSFAYALSVSGLLCCLKLEPISCPHGAREELDKSMELPWPCLCPTHLARVKMDVGGCKPQALIVMGAWPQICA